MPAIRRWIHASGLALASVASLAQPACDSLHQVDFTWQGYGTYGIAFTPGAPASGAPVLYTEWGFAGESLLDYSTQYQPTYTFPAPGNYLACLRATVQDDQQGYCLSTACQVIDVPVDAQCAGLAAAFTIEVQGSGIHFIDQSQSGQPITGWQWAFGDGGSSSETSPVYTYSGPGPFRACLTVSSGNCAATACNWIYLGPPDVPCDTLLQADIGILQLGPSIAVFDQSIVSGMNSSVTWDFGDGTSANGSPQIHTYQYDGYYDVCATVSLWGPLTPDTCSATACEYVYTDVSTGLPAASKAGNITVGPNPFTDQLAVEGVNGGGNWQLTDALGRVCLSGNFMQSSPGRLSVKGLVPGSYLLRIHVGQQTMVLRVVRGN